VPPVGKKIILVPVGSGTRRVSDTHTRIAIHRSGIGFPVLDFVVEFTVLCQNVSVSSVSHSLCQEHTQGSACRVVPHLSPFHAGISGRCLVLPFF
jgi:hypothetical protein